MLFVASCELLALDGLRHDHHSRAYYHYYVRSIRNGLGSQIINQHNKYLVFAG